MAGVGMHGGGADGEFGLRRFLATASRAPSVTRVGGDGSQVAGAQDGSSEHLGEHAAERGQAGTDDGGITFDRGPDCCEGVVP